MRVRVLPRDVAGRIISGTLALMGCTVGAATIVLTVPMLVETLVRRGRAGDLPLPLLMLAIVLAGVVLVVLRPRRSSVLVFLGVAATASVVYELLLLRGDPGMQSQALYLLNRPTLLLVEVGVAASSPLAGFLWTAIGYAAANAVTLVVAVLASVPVEPGLGPTLVFVIAGVGYGTFAAIQTGQRRRLPNFDELEGEIRRMALDDDLARRTTAIVHDTALNDLAIVMNAPDLLDDRTRDRLRRDLDTLRNGEWLSVSGGVATIDDQHASLHNELMLLVSEFQWRGLTVHVTGAIPGVRRFAPEAVAALLGSVQACFENVLRHSGASVAELELVDGADALTVMLADQGRGFDPGAVPADRLGLRMSVQHRLAAVGGSAQIWSSPGEGTSVLLTIPVVPGGAALP
ncbi:sensor histidine kinase, partial [Mesorhizobium japonicum]|uniref:sensor histidine kinase n=1 Tax=Mesorhizobium japonicum TaxID=2066070 RepID=UPI003B58E19F